jgi:uncharacterized protein DUF1905/bacteriocin resistance YdeI/OmpD-like protein
MKFSFTAKIFKVGINPCVSVPARITAAMKAVKGYIPVKGKIGKHPFLQTLVPVKNADYRLFVNGPMLKGSGASPGDTVKFFIEQDFAPRTPDAIKMPDELKKQLSKNKLQSRFKQLTHYRQKEILKYLNYLKTEEALLRNIDKVIKQLKK